LSIFKNHKTSADRSASDRSSHKEKIRRAIKEGVHHIISDESIIGKDGKKKIRIPVRGIKEYRFVYGDNDTNKNVGSGNDKDVKRNQKISSRKKRRRPGEGEAGDSPGEELYDVEITLEELAYYLFDDLNLPEPEKKKMIDLVIQKPKRKGYRDHGIKPRLSKKETLKNKLRRKKSSSRENSDLTEGGEEPFSFHKSDLRYKHIKNKNKKNSNAVIFFMMDTSGSMNSHKKFLARSFFFLLYHFIRHKYDDVEIVFISHTSEAKEVNEEIFFKKSNSGGTIISSALEKMLEISNKRYHPDIWNIYSFHCSDGDNWPSDNPKSVELSLKIKEMSQMYAYVQTASNTDYAFWTDGGIAKEYNKISDSKFKIAYLEKKEDVWSEFKRILGGSRVLDF